MDNYNHNHSNMMDSEYGNIVYGSGMQQQQQPPQQMQDETMLPPAPSAQHVKEASYMSRESCIASTVPIVESFVAATDTDTVAAAASDKQTNLIGNGGDATSVDPIVTTTTTTEAATDAADVDMNSTEESGQSKSNETNDKETEPIAESPGDGVATKKSVKAAEKVKDESTKTTTLKIEPVVKGDAGGGADAEGVEEEVEEGAEEEEEEEDEIDVKPIAQRKVAPEKVVDPNQCRICLSKNGLVNIFSYDNSVRISDKIMTICTRVKIDERDFLPHYVCAGCLDKVKIAIDFKAKCETTDKELRSKLRRSNTKARKRRDFVIVDCELSSGDSDDNAKDDDEFHISDVEAVEDDSEPTSVSSYESDKKKRVGRKRGRKPGPKPKLGSAASSAAASTPTGKKTGNQHDLVFVETEHMSEAEEEDDDDDEEEEESEEEKPIVKRRGRKPKPETIAARAAAAAAAKAARKSGGGGAKDSEIPHKKRAIKPEDTDEDDLLDDEYEDEPKRRRRSSKKEFICQYCDKSYTTQVALKEHRRSHIGEKPLSCTICQKGFKQRVSLDAHIQKHKEDDSRTCKPCDKQFASKFELRKHLTTMHGDEYTFECGKCKKTFTTQSRLDKHKDGKCPGYDTTVPRKNRDQKKRSEHEVSTPHVGRDLFKCVAPLTTTYWSDSFSE